MSFERIILSGVLILGLCACNGNLSGNSEIDAVIAASNLSSEKNTDLVNTVNEAMTALKKLDMDTFNANTNNRQIMVTPWGSEHVEYTLFGELSEEQHTDSPEDLVYQLDKKLVKNLSWEILDITQKNDDANLKLRITNLNMEGIFQRAETDSRMISEISKIPQTDTKTVDLDLMAEKENGKWILSVDVDFANAISANIWVYE